MITCFALSEGAVTLENVEAFRAAVLEEFVPFWGQFTGNTDVRVMLGEERDDGAPEFPLILAIGCPDRAVMDNARDNPARFKSKEVTGDITGMYFDERIHHHAKFRHEFLA